MHSVLIRTAKCPSLENKNSVLLNNGKGGGREKRFGEDKGVRMEVER